MTEFMAFCSGFMFGFGFVGLIFLESLGYIFLILGIVIVALNESAKREGVTE